MWGEDMDMLDKKTKEEQFKIREFKIQEMEQTRLGFEDCRFASHLHT